MNKNNSVNSGVSVRLRIEDGFENVPCSIHQSERLERHDHVVELLQSSSNFNRGALLFVNESDLVRQQAEVPPPTSKVGKYLPSRHPYRQFVNSQPV